MLLKILFISRFRDTGTKAMHSNCSFNCWYITLARVVLPKPPTPTMDITFSCFHVPSCTSNSVSSSLWPLLSLATHTMQTRVDVSCQRRWDYNAVNLVPIAALSHLLDKGLHIFDFHCNLMLSPCSCQQSHAPTNELFESLSCG